MRNMKILTVEFKIEKLFLLAMMWTQVVNMNNFIEQPVTGDSGKQRLLVEATFLLCVKL